METPGPSAIERFDAHEAVMALIYEYSRLVDRGDFDAVGELFRQGRYTIGPDRVLAGTAIGERLRTRLRVYDDGTPRTVHLNPNVVVTFNGDMTRAQARTPVQVFQAFAGEIKCIYLGHYDDAFATDGSEWYFTSRAAITTLVGDMSAHIVGGRSADTSDTSSGDRNRT